MGLYNFTCNAPLNQMRLGLIYSVDLLYVVGFSNDQPRLALAWKTRMHYRPTFGREPPTENINSR